MSGPTQAQGQQGGDCHLGSTQMLEVKEWEFEPTQKCGSVVTNVTGGFEGQVMGGIGGSGSVTLLIPKTGYQTPPQFGTTPILNLYADAARLHGYTNIPIAVEKNSVKIDLSSAEGIKLTFRFKANGPYNAIGAFAVLGAFNDESTSSSGT
jgi:hypothetical protein